MPSSKSGSLYYYWHEPYSTAGLGWLLLLCIFFTICCCSRHIFIPRVVLVPLDSPVLCPVRIPFLNVTMMQAAWLNNTDLILEYDLFMFSQHDAIIRSKTEYFTKSKILQMKHWLSKTGPFLNCVKLKTRGSKNFAKVSLLWKSAVCSAMEWDTVDFVVLTLSCM